VSGREPFQYAALRIVPRVERGEALNAGVVLFCRPLRFLGARTQLDEALLRALAPDCDPAGVRAALETIERIAAGDAAGGPIAALPPSERAVQHDRAAGAGAHRADRRPRGRTGPPVLTSRRALTK
jgi:hypothetical protein